MKYRHFKGGIYEFLHEARLENNPDARVVVYRAEDGGVWVRAWESFYGDVEVAGIMVPRFAQIE